MRYDDPLRPKFEHSGDPLQVNGHSALPVITLIRPMEGEGEAEYRCTRAAVAQKTLHCPNANAECPECDRASETILGWLACIHAHRAGPSYSYHTGWIRSLSEFSEAYLADPEGALEKYFKYSGPEPRRANAAGGNAPDLWESTDGSATD